MLSGKTYGKRCWNLWLRKSHLSELITIIIHTTTIGEEDNMEDNTGNNEGQAANIDDGNGNNLSDDFISSFFW